MFVKLDEINTPMKPVYHISKGEEGSPEYIELVQNLTLDKSRPFMGLNGTYGLYYSEEWWGNIMDGTMPMFYLSGIITRAYIGGQDYSHYNNTMDILLDDGTMKKMVPIYVNQKKDALLFQPGHLVKAVCALDKFKPKAIINFKEKYSEITLEMAVSLEPVK